MSLGIDGQPSAPGAVVYVNEVSDGYFAAMGTRLVRSRDFAAQDTPGSTPVAAVGERPHCRPASSARWSGNG